MDFLPGNYDYKKMVFPGRAGSRIALVSPKLCGYLAIKLIRWNIGSQKNTGKSRRPRRGKRPSGNGGMKRILFHCQTPELGFKVLNDDKNEQLREREEYDSLLAQA